MSDAVKSPPNETRAGKPASASGFTPGAQHVSIKAAFSDARSMFHPMLILLWVAVALTVDEYYFLPGSFSELFPDFAIEHRGTMLGH